MLFARAVACAVALSLACAAAPAFARRAPAKKEDARRAESSKKNAARPKKVAAPTPAVVKKPPQKKESSDKERPPKAPSPSRAKSQTLAERVQAEKEAATKTKPAARDAKKPALRDAKKKTAAKPKPKRPVRALPANASWAKYRRPPWRRGHVTLAGHGKKWSGYLVDAENEVLPAAHRSLSRVLGSWRTGKQLLIDEKLIRLIADVSDEFGGRTIRIVSGYREHSYAQDSKHKTGEAFDFSIPGVPNEMLRDFLRSLGKVGVGYYPNSTHVHLDVRTKPAYWVDYSFPGLRPAYSTDRRFARWSPRDRAIADALDAIALPKPSTTRPAPGASDRTRPRFDRASGIAAEATLPAAAPALTPAAPIADPARSPAPPRVADGGASRAAVPGDAGTDAHRAGDAGAPANHGRDAGSAAP